MNKKMNKKKVALMITMGMYIAALGFTSLYVPVKASIRVEVEGEGEDTYMEYGYYPVWEIREAKVENTGMEVSINITAWVIQYVFITLVFILLFLRVGRGSFFNQ